MAKRTKDAETEVTLPITPMLDMTFQLMFFFLATFQPSSIKEVQMDMSLPAKSDPAAQRPEDVKPTSESIKEEIEDKAIVTVTIRGFKDEKNRGMISYLTINSDNANEEELSGTEDKRKELLAARLKKIKPPDTDAKDDKKKIPTVRMAAESDVKWSEVMKMMDVCYKGGYLVSFVKPPDLGGK